MKSSMKLSIFQAQSSNFSIEVHDFFFLNFRKQLREQFRMNPVQSYVQ